MPTHTVTKISHQEHYNQGLIASYFHGMEVPATSGLAIMSMLKAIVLKKNKKKLLKRYIRGYSPW